MASLKMNGSIWKKFWIDAYEHRDKTFGWPMDLKGVYFSLLFWQWQNGTIPWSEDFIQKLCQCPIEKAREYLDSLDPFFDRVRTRTMTYERRVDPGIHGQRELRKQQSKKLREAGVLGAKKRWGTLNKRKEERALADILAEAQELADKEEEKTVQEAAPPESGAEKPSEPLPKAEPHSHINPIQEVRKHWEAESKRVGKGRKLLRADAIVLAELGEAHRTNLSEAKKRITAYIEDTETPTPEAFRAQWAAYNRSAMEAREEALEVSRADADRENRKRAQLVKEFGSPGSWSPEEKRRRHFVVCEWLRKRLPERETREARIEKHMTPGKVLAALQNDRARNPQFYM